MLQGLCWEYFVALLLYIVQNQICFIAWYSFTAL